MPAFINQRACVVKSFFGNLKRIRITSRRISVRCKLYLWVLESDQHESTPVHHHDAYFAANLFRSHHLFKHAFRTKLDLVCCVNHEGHRATRLQRYASPAHRPQPAHRRLDLLYVLCFINSDPTKTDLDRVHS